MLVWISQGAQPFGHDFHCPSSNGEDNRIPVFLLFMDLKKAYDFIPCAALWCALRKLGVPDILIDTSMRA